MLKREKLETMLRKMDEGDFAAIWKRTYGCFPEGCRQDLAKDFAAEQYDGELDGCIATVESLITHVPIAKPVNKPRNKWLPPG
jgi:hypothetical protein